MGCIISKHVSEISVISVCMNLYCEITLNIISILSTHNRRDGESEINNLLTMMTHFTELTAVRDYLCALAPYVKEDKVYQIRKTFTKDILMFVSFMSYIQDEYPELNIRQNFYELHRRLDDIYKLHCSPLSKMYDRLPTY